MDAKKRQLVNLDLFYSGGSIDEKLSEQEVKYYKEVFV